MYEEVKGRPLFLISEELGVEREAPGPSASEPGEPRSQ
jgi:hypothetical protein